MSRVVHLTSAHDWTDTRIFEKECRSLAEHGHHVTLVAPGAPTGERHGVAVVGIERPRGRGGRLLRTPWTLYRAALARRPDVVHLHDPEMLPVGVVLARRGVAVVWDAHESLDLQLQGRRWLPAWLRPALGRALGRMERWCGRRFAAAVGATTEIAARLTAPRVATVQNLPLRREFEATPTPYGDRPQRVLYVGNLTEARGAVEMVQAAEAFPAGVELAVAGAFGEPGLQRRVEDEPGWARVRLLGWLDRAGVAEALAGARVGMVVLHPEPNYLAARPVKLFEYLAAGVPVVASDFPAWQGLVGDSGLLVDPRSPAEIATAVTWLLEHPDEAEAMGERGRARVLDELNWATQADALVDLYDRIGDGSARVAAGAAS